MNNKQKHQLLAVAAKKFVELGDNPGIFMTCESGGEDKPCVRLSCQNLAHAQKVHNALIEIINTVRLITQSTSVPTPL